MYKHILVPTDGSPLSNKAARTAVDLARRYKGKVTAMYVMAPYSPPTDMSEIAISPESHSPTAYKERAEKEANAALRKVQRAAAAAHVPFAGVSVTAPAPWEAIVDSARAKRCDVIVMGSHGRNSLATLLLGSQTNKVLTHSKKPVLVFR